MSEERPFRVVEDRIPLEGIADSVGEVVELFGGEVTSRGEGTVAFTLPRRRGVAVAGGVACEIRWAEGEGGEGEVVLEAAEGIEAPPIQRILLLGAGSIGALLGLAWPFFPRLGALSGIGVLVAFATYFITLRTVPGGVAAEIVERIARRQRTSRSG